MIRSMTAFGTGRADSAHGSVTIEFRTVNSRYLDINFRLPDDLRMVEGLIRDNLGQVVVRGKVDIRVNYTKTEAKTLPTVDVAYLTSVAEQLQTARRIIPDVPAPNLHQLLDVSNGAGNASFDPDVWSAMSVEATKQALTELQAAREREGQRLASIMLDCASEVADIVDDVEADLPTILADHREKIVNKLRDTLMAVSPDGFSQISGAELSARIAQEASFFALRIDVAEELARLRSHIAELRHLLGTGQTSTRKEKKGGGSAGKRLDFLFQEMNREANTLGSKASALSVTRAAIDLKLLIEQMREQAQNIE